MFLCVLDPIPSKKEDFYKKNFTVVMFYTQLGQ
jgi:hypothetical protein